MYFAHFFIEIKGWEISVGIDDIDLADLRLILSRLILKLLIWFIQVSKTKKTFRNHVKDRLFVFFFVCYELFTYLYVSRFHAKTTEQFKLTLVQVV